MAKKSKQKKNKEKANELHYDANAYGYKQGEKVPFEGNLVLWAMSLAQQVAIKETTVTYEMKDSFEATQKTGKEKVSDLGLQALRLVELLTNGHLENIDANIATHQNVLVRGAQAGSPEVAPEEPKFEMKVVKED